MQVTPYLFFDGRCEEALEFYKKALGAQVGMMMRMGESPDKSHMPPGSENKIMHAAFKIGEKTLFASDGHNKGKPEFKGFSLSLDAKDEASATKMFNALKDGGNVTLAPTKTFFSPCFGMVTDKFGVGWMVIVEPSK